MKELLALTGYIRGGVTVLGAKKAFPVFADETIQLWDSISSLSRHPRDPDHSAAGRLPARYRSRDGRHCARQKLIHICLKALRFPAQLS